jgi:hypothetical protein
MICEGIKLGSAEPAEPFPTHFVQARKRPEQAEPAEPTYTR